MTEIMKELTCPICNSKDFLEGPHGGDAINIKCSKCRYWMNVVVTDRGYLLINEGVISK